MKLSEGTKYCPIYFCKLAGALAATGDASKEFTSKPNHSTNKDSNKSAENSSKNQTIHPTHSGSSSDTTPKPESRKSLSHSTRLVYEKKRKAALIGVLTLGLAGLSVLGVGNTWRMNIFAGTSFDSGGVGFVMKCISFCLISVIVAIPCFIISFFRLIYYSIKLSQ